MKTLGISIGRTRIAAVLWEGTALASRGVRSVGVECTEPFGGKEDVARLARILRGEDPSPELPPAVLTLPPPWIHLRRIRLPVTDLARARKIHEVELSGNLPLPDEEILSDLLPPAREEPDHFLAVAASRKTVERAVASYVEAGFRVDRVVADPVALLALLGTARREFSGAAYCGENEQVVLQLSRGAIRQARLFPGGAEADPAVRDEIRGLFGEESGGEPPRETVFLGEVPPPSAGPPPARVSLPGAPEGVSPLALGAALVPLRASLTGGFSLRTSAEAEAEASRAKFRVKAAAVAAAATLLALLGALEAGKWAGQRRVAVLQQTLRKEFTEAVPSVRNVVRETAQARERIEDLRKQRKELGADLPGATALLEKASLALPAAGGLAAREVVFDSGRLRISGEADAASLVESYRAALAEAFGPGREVTVQESSGSARGRGVKFTILVREKGDGRAS